MRRAPNCAARASEPSRGLSVHTPPPREDETCRETTRGPRATLDPPGAIREMIAPGTYAVLAPLFVGFLVGPATLVGVLGGAIVSGAMVAIGVEIT